MKNAPYLPPGMAATMKVAMVSTIVVQTDNNTANLDHYINDFVVQAAQEKADLVLFPEMALTGYMHEQPGQAFTSAETIPGPSVNKLVDAAKQYNIYIAMGMIEASSDNLGFLYNSMVLVGREGLVGKQRKLSIENFAFNATNWGIIGGSEISVFKLSNGWKVGMPICYDFFMPEVPRVMAVEGANLFLVAAGTPPGGDTWSQFNQVRCFENRVGLAFAGIAGTYDGVPFSGTRMAVDPYGQPIFQMEGTSDTEGMSYATFKADDVYQARKQVPCIRDRVPAAYGALVA